MDNQTSCGQRRTHKGQAYTCLGVREVRRGGRVVKTVRGWESVCAECGRAFRFEVMAWRKTISPNRNCMPHTTRPTQAAKRR